MTRDTEYVKLCLLNISIIMYSLPCGRLNKVGMKLVKINITFAVSLSRWFWLCFILHGIVLKWNIKCTHVFGQFAVGFYRGNILKYFFGVFFLLWHLEFSQICKLQEHHIHILTAFSVSGHLHTKTWLGIHTDTVSCSFPSRPLGVPWTL